VLFDFDGLLVDTEQVWFDEWRAVFADHGLDLTPQIWTRCVGTVGTSPHDELERELGREVDRDIGRAADSAAERGSHELDLRAGGWDLIRAIDEAGLRRAIVTSSPSMWIDEHITRLKCDGWSAIVSAEGSPERSKPNPTLYLEALQILQLAPDEAVVLEDSTNGILAAKAAGIRCIAVPNGVTRTFDLSAADEVLDSLADVFGAIQ
jgi:beta-phosphoglucomutase-like phosphatase (HAD superfamily)